MSCNIICIFDRMKKLTQKVVRFLADESGPTSVEYACLLMLVILACLTAITVAGLHAVGAILMVALVIIPPATARFWTERFRWMLVIAAVIGVAIQQLRKGLPGDVPSIVRTLSGRAMC